MGAKRLAALALTAFLLVWASVVWPQHGMPGVGGANPSTGQPGVSAPAAGAEVSCPCWTGENIIATNDDCAGVVSPTFDTTPPSGFVFISCDAGVPTTTYTGILASTPTCEVTTDILGGPVPETALSSEENDACYAELVIADEGT